MEYKYTPNDNYEDFASGRVLYHMGGEPTFPVRLTLELYERCLYYSNKKKSITLYDCCCGGAYLLTILGFMKNDTIEKIYGSDIDLRSIKLAEDNLRLLTKPGIQRRRDELTVLYDKYQKDSHKYALDSINRIEKRLLRDIQTCVFQRNVIEIGDLLFCPDIIITDVPYGNLVEWGEQSTGVNQMMESIATVCSKETIICVCMNKSQKIQTDRFMRLEKQLVGKRKFEIYQLKG